MVFVSREFIVVLDYKKGQIFFKHLDYEIRKFIWVIVNVDEVALFVNKGIVVVQFGLGQYQIDVDEILGFGVLIDLVMGGNVYKVELYFVSTWEFIGERFGGWIDDVQDLVIGFIVMLRIFGEYVMRVADLVKVVTNLVGIVDVSDNIKIIDWVDVQLLKVMKIDLICNVVCNGWFIFGLLVFIFEIEFVVVVGANAQFQLYGFELVCMGNFDLNLVEEDE